MEKNFGMTFSTKIVEKNFGKKVLDKKIFE